MNDDEKKNREKILGQLQPLFNRSPIFVLCMLFGMLFLVRSIEGFWQVRIVVPLIILILSTLGLGITLGVCVGFSIKTVNADNFSNFSSKKKHKKIKR